MRENNYTDGLQLNQAWSFCSNRLSQVTSPWMLRLHPEAKNSTVSGSRSNTKYLKCARTPGHCAIPSNDVYYYVFDVGSKTNFSKCWLWSADVYLVENSTRGNGVETWAVFTYRHHCVLETSSGFGPILIISKYSRFTTNVAKLYSCIAALKSPLTNKVHTGRIVWRLACLEFSFFNKISPKSTSLNSLWNSRP